MTMVFKFFSYEPYLSSGHSGRPAEWWLVGVAAAAGGVGYALGARQWWHTYRNDPVAHTGGASPRLLAALGVIACLGLAALLALG